MISDARLETEVELELFQRRHRVKEVFFRKLVRDLVFLFFHNLAAHSVFVPVPAFSSVGRTVVVSSTVILCFLEVS